MNYNNLDLNSHEADVKIVDDLTFNDLLLQIDCNLPKHNINKVTVQAEFDMVLTLITKGAEDLFKTNLNNIVKKAKK